MESVFGRVENSKNKLHKSHLISKTIPLLPEKKLSITLLKSIPLSVGGPLA